MFKNIKYLKYGNQFQQSCFHILSELGIVEFLSVYNPLLVGTIPLGINIEGSDADIICCATDLKILQLSVFNEYGAMPGFSDQISDKRYVASFTYSDLPIEIYAEDCPTEIQNGYRHMVIEDRILNIAGEPFKSEIIRLKKSGYKTEPAFGKLLNLDNPYSELLELSEKTYDELYSYLAVTLKTKRSH